MKNLFKGFMVAAIAIVAMACSTDEPTQQGGNGLAAPEMGANANENSITVSWTAVEGAAYYEIWLNDGAHTKTDKTVHRFEGLKWETEYTVNLMAVGAGDTNSAVVSQKVVIAARKVPAYREWIPQNGSTATSISDNGRWVVGCFDRQSMIIDLDTDEIELIENFDCMDVADNGLVVGATYEDSQSGEAAILIDGKCVKLDLSDLTESTMSSFTAVTPDGEYIVGWWWEYDENSYYGRIYGYIVPFAYDVLKDRITVLECGENVYPIQGISAAAVSPERKIVGVEQSNAMMAVVWEDEYAGFTYPVFEYDSEYRPTHTFGDTQTRMTTNGKYIYSVSKTYPDSSTDLQQPACFDLETNTLTTFEGPCSIGSVSAMTNDGVVFLNNVPIGYETAYVSHVDTPEIQTPIVDWLLDENNIDLYNYMNVEENSYVIIGASADGRTLLALGYTEQGHVSIVISLDGEPMPEI